MYSINGTIPVSTGLGREKQKDLEIKVKAP
jgi:hypothetical protein